MKKFNNKLFRQTLSKFATGVTVVAINSNKKIIGKTVNSFSALSLKPPLVLFCLDKKTSDLKEFIKNKYLSINILSNKQSEISKNFAKKDSKWKNIPFKLSKLNSPIIDKSLANLECQIVKSLKEGDHIIVICKVVNLYLNDKLKPLLYFNSNYIK